MLKKTIGAVALFALSAGNMAFSDTVPDADKWGSFSGGVSFTNDYVFRGVTQSDHHPAVQGSLDYSVDLPKKVEGYLGMWGSNVDFNDSDATSAEFDFYAGARFNIRDVSVDIGEIFYKYPDAASSLKYDYWETMVSLGYTLYGVDMTASLNYSPNNFGGSGKAEYIKLALGYTLPHDIALDGHVGHQHVERNTIFGYRNYTDWSVGVGYEWKGVSFHAAFVDTDLGTSDCSTACNAKGIFTVSKSF